MHSNLSIFFIIISKTLFLIIKKGKFAKGVLMSAFNLNSWRWDGMACLSPAHTKKKFTFLSLFEIIL